jgi:hypothetical protein
VECPMALGRSRGWRAVPGPIAASFRRILPLGDEVNRTLFTHTKGGASGPQNPPHPRRLPQPTPNPPHRTRK